MHEGRSGRWRRWLIALSLGLMLAAMGAGYLYRDFRRTPLPVGPKGYRLLVPQGASLRQVAARLHRDGILRHPALLVWLGRWRGDAQRIRAGEYALGQGLRPDGLLDRLVRGQVVQHQLTLVEGWTFHRMMQAVEAEPALVHRLRGLDDAAIMAAIGHPGEKPEGRFYPETYRFPRGTTDIAFLQRAYDAMAERLRSEWAGRAPGLPLKNPYQALILASIIEKETARDEERPLIAGVFIRRLQRGMRLQTDPTVIYGLGEAFDGNIRRRDLAHDTAFNTYTRPGLPPTPICLPRGTSIHAALHPAAGDALYFVSRGDGSHQFSATLEEHQRAVRKYQLGRHP